MYTRILVPLDGSKLSECSLAQARNLARGNPGIEVVLLVVQEEILPFTSVSFSESKAREMAAQRDKMNRDVAQKIEKYLSGQAEGLTKEGLAVKTEILHPEPLKSIAEVIMDYAEASKSDLIVMSTHGRTGFQRWAIGSVADRVMRYSRVPVLVVPAAVCGV